jgi:N-hydroxyarylamine O-acetyltransferase
VERLLARVGPDGEPRRPRTHLTLRVGAGSGLWLADVGFGSAPPGPLTLRSGGPRDLDGWIYEVIHDEDEAGTWKLREFQDGEWVTLYRFEDQRAYPADVVMSNHYTATYPESWFTWQPIVVRRDPDAIHSIVGRTYTVTRPGYVKTRRTLSDDEFAAALTDIFGLTFTEPELAALIAAPAGLDREPAPRPARQHQLNRDAHRNAAP